MKAIYFDVIGTCFDFDTVIQGIQELGHSHDLAKALFFSWFYAAQRDFTYSSIAGTYHPIAKVLKATLPRAFKIQGLSISDDEATQIMKLFASMSGREGLKRCFDGLMKDHDVYAVTNGGHETTLKYFSAAGITLQNDHVLSCDSLERAKPDLSVYEAASKTSNTEKWFVAAHAWDLQAARARGFKTAWISYEEVDPVSEIFGEFDVYADSMDDLLKKLK